MKAPFDLPLVVDGVAAYSQDGQPLFGWRGTTEQKKFIVHAINTHEVLVEYYEASKELERLENSFGSWAAERMAAWRRLDEAAAAVERVL